MEYGDPASEPADGPRTGLTLDDLLTWSWACFDTCLAHRDLLDDLNLYPVADHDTGTNLVAFWAAFAEALLADLADRMASGHGEPSPSTVKDSPRSPQQLPARSRDFATGLHNALDLTVTVDGSSAAIIRAWLGGWREETEGDVTSGLVPTADLLPALSRAARVASDAVTDPVNGSMLTALTEFARELEDAVENSLQPTKEAPPALDGTDSAAPGRGVLAAHAAVAMQATERTLDALRAPVPDDPDDLPNGLTEVGPATADAGAFGAMLCLAELVALLSAPANPPTNPPVEPTSRHCESDSARPTDQAISSDGMHEITGSCRVVNDATRANLRAALAAVGTSVVLSGYTRRRTSFHVHAREVGAVEAALAQHADEVQINVSPVYAQRAKRLQASVDSSRLVLLLGTDCQSDTHADDPRIARTDETGLAGHLDANRSHQVLVLCGPSVDIHAVSAVCTQRRVYGAVLAVVAADTLVPDAVLAPAAFNAALGRHVLLAHGAATAKG